MMNVTPESIAAAKAATAREREAIRQATGLVIRDDGVIRPIEVVCGLAGCRFVASALTESRALRRWAHHRLSAHQTLGGRPS